MRRRAEARCSTEAALTDLRVLLLADTHLGLPGSFPPFERALQPAFRSEVDLVVHGGDVFYRSQVKRGLVLDAFEPLKRIADSGVPVVVVPGNHERSAIPYPLLAAHPGVHVFDRPRTFAFDLGGMRVAISGFPNDRDAIRERFAGLVERTEWSSVRADVRLLCLHQTVEGATVGPADFVFRGAADVIPGSSVPRGFAAVLAGHIHRHQVLRSDLRRRRLAAPVFYPGSTMRTSSAERFEAKGFVTMAFAAGDNGGRIWSWRFHELDAPAELLGETDPGFDLAEARVVAERIEALVHRQRPVARAERVAQPLERATSNASGGEIRTPSALSGSARS